MLFQSTFPPETSSSDIFREALDYLDAALHHLPPSDNLIIMGDFNADPGHLGGPLSTTSTNTQGRILLQFMDKFNLVSTHLHKSNLLLSHMYESDAHHSVSTIDHILCSKHLLSAILQASLIDDHPLNTSDHFPVVAELIIHLPPPSLLPSSSNSPQKQPFISRNWSGTSKEDIIAGYTSPSSVSYPYSAISLPTHL